MLFAYGVCFRGGRFWATFVFCSLSMFHCGLALPPRHCQSCRRQVKDNAMATAVGQCQEVAPQKACEVTAASARAIGFSAARCFPVHCGERARSLCNVILAILADVLKATQCKQIESRLSECIELRKPAGDGQGPRGKTIIACARLHDCTSQRLQIPLEYKDFTSNTGCMCIHEDRSGGHTSDPRGDGRGRTAIGRARVARTSHMNPPPALNGNH